MKRRAMAWSLALAVVACSTAGPSGDQRGEPAATELTVFAAASLADAFEEVAAALERQQEDLEVRLNLAGSQTLASQLLEGAPGDVFASADIVQMERVVSAGHAAPPRDFATNELVVAVEPGNPRAIRSLGDLARDDLLVVLPIEEAPAGRYAAAVLAEAGVDVSPASLELDVRAALGKVVLGEADATIAYRSDVAAVEGRAEAIPLPSGRDAGIRYPVAVLRDADRPAATAFVEFLLSESGRDLLRRHGFGAP